MSKKTLEDISKKFDDKRDKVLLDLMPWEEMYGKGNHPIDIVKQFIMDKGLKIYGGLALNELLKKKGKPIYGKNEFPDYDVFSPNAWEHAKELSDILHNRLNNSKSRKVEEAYVEARSSILNDEHHQTYKVGVDFIDMLDLTQCGCTVQHIADHDCEKCGASSKGQCISLFNHVPTYNINDSKANFGKKIYTKTYDYNTNSGIYKKKLFVCEPEWMRISMYRELTEPIDNPGRLVKVSSRLDLLNKVYPTNFKVCKKIEYLSSKVSDPIKKKLTALNNANANEEPNFLTHERFPELLTYVGDYVKNFKLVNYGQSAYNFYVKGIKKLSPIKVNNYEVYIASQNISVEKRGKDTHEQYDQILLKELKKDFKKYDFKIDYLQRYWKEVDVDNVVISVRHGKKPYHKLITFSVIETCMPYNQYGGVRYATVDRLKYLYFRGAVIPEVMTLSDGYSTDYKCLLVNILKAEKEYKKKYSAKKIQKTKFRRFVAKCVGERETKRWTNLFKKVEEKRERLKKTQIKINYPKEGYKTTTEPLAGEHVIVPYRPLISKLQQNYTKYYKQKKTKKKKTYKVTNNNVL